MRPERTAVTGAGRELGAALLERLRAAGGPEPLALQQVPGERTTRRALRGVATVVHLAPSRDAQAGAAQRQADLAGTRALLAAARPAGVRRVVLVTSTEVHRAAPGQVPLPEDAEVAAPADGTLVGAHVETERLADHARRTGLDVVVLRPAALAGVEPDQIGTPLRSLAAGRLLAVRGVEPLWQLCHADDLLSALERTISISRRSGATQSRTKSSRFGYAWRERTGCHRRSPRRAGAGSVILVPTLAFFFRNTASRAMKPASFRDSFSVTTVHGRPSAGLVSRVKPCASSAITPI
jgi:nucleoside-diphosphate-sugar epimerase